MKYFLFLLLFITSSSTKLISQNLVKELQKHELINLNTKFPIFNHKEKYSLIDDNEFLVITKKSKKQECVFLDSIFKNNVYDKDIIKSFSYAFQKLYKIISQ